MKKSQIIICLCASAFGLTTAGTGWGATITDNYLGGLLYDGTLYDYTDDIVNDDSRYSIEKMEVTIGSTSTTVNIYTNYINYVTLADNIEFGDLFLSNNGWNPHTPTSSDYYDNGEFWEFALVLDVHDGSSLSGNAYLYQISNKNQYILAEDTGSSVFRGGQEVLLNTTGLTPSATGSWSIFAEGISFTIGTEYLNLGSADLGLRWSMTCANDIIEGSVPTPEPTTVLLFGTGLIGLAGLRRKIRK